MTTEKPMAKQNHLKVGDRLVQYGGHDSWERRTNKYPIRILTVQRTTKTLAICGDSVYERIPICESPATDEEIKKAEAYLAEKENRRLEMEKKRRDEMADPRYPYINRLRNGDFVSWEKLTLEQLKQIAKLLDDANA